MLQAPVFTGFQKQKVKNIINGCTFTSLIFRLHTYILNLSSVQIQRIRAIDYVYLVRKLQGDEQQKHSFFLLYNYCCP